MTQETEVAGALNQDPYEPPMYIINLPTSASTLDEAHTLAAKVVSKVQEIRGLLVSSTTITREDPALRILIAKKNGSLGE